MCVRRDLRLRWASRSAHPYRDPSPPKPIPRRLRSVVCRPNRCDTSGKVVISHGDRRPACGPGPAGGFRARRDHDHYGPARRRVAPAPGRDLRYLTSRYLAAFRTSTPLPVRQLPRTRPWHRSGVGSHPERAEARASVGPSRCPTLRSPPRPPAQQARSWNPPGQWETPDANFGARTRLMCRYVAC